ncbi:MAG TPA: peroxide stress protein YaaA [Acidimicrobiales bacterium]|nr:peroxide stress protein YaaA [Acidimicrobiales bacterium]
MPSPLVLLPPSEGKRPGGSRRARHGAFDDELGATRLDVLERLGAVLVTSSQAERESILGVRGALFERAEAALLALLAGEATLRPVWQRYSGVVWSHLEPETLRVAQRRRLIVPSGLYGLNAGDDLVADYRLKMSARLRESSVGSLWRPLIAASLARHARGRTVYDLLPLEHRSVLDAADLAATRVVTVTFRHARDGRLAGHDAKAAKGVFARHLLTTTDVASFSWRGWSARAEGSRVDVLYDD